MKNYFNRFKLGVLCFCSVLMFSLNFNFPEIAGSYGVVYEVFENIRLSLNSNFFEMTIFWMCLLYVQMQIDKKTKKNFVSVSVFNVILAILWLLSESLQIDNTFNHIRGSAGQVIKSIIYVLGAMNILDCVSRLIYMLFQCSAIKKNERVDRSNKIMVFFNRYTYLSFFIIVFLFWIPNTILSLPASIEFDVWDSIMMYFGDLDFTSHHPVVFTILVGKIAQIGYDLGDINIGFAIWVIFQTIFASAIMAYTLFTMKKFQTPKWLIILTFLTGVFSPYYSAYVTTIVKDTMYSFAVLLLTVELFYMYCDLEKYWKSKVHILLFSVASMIMLLFRHNGKYIIFVMVGFIIVMFIKHHKSYSNIFTVRSVLLALLPILVSGALTRITISTYEVIEQKGEGMREALSIPFQQTARTAKYFGDEISDEDKTVIDTVIDYYCMADVYEPIISDPVKARFHREASMEDWINYFKVWFKYLLKYPFTYFGATFNQNYFMIYPMQENIRLYPNTYVDYFWDHDFMDKVGAQKVMTFESGNEVRLSFYKLLQVFPISGLMSCLTVYNILLVYLILFCIHSKKLKFLGITIPVVLSILVVIAGPCIYDNVRYALPIVYTMPIVLAYYFKSNESV